MALSQEEKARAKEILNRLSQVYKEKDELRRLQAKCPHENKISVFDGFSWRCVDCGYEPED